MMIKMEAQTLPTYNYYYYFSSTDGEEKRKVSFSVHFATKTK